MAPPRFIAIERPDRPPCAECGPGTHKSALFRDLRLKRDVCAKCMVEAQDKTAAWRASHARQILRSRRTLSAFGIIALVVAFVAPAAAQDLITIRWKTVPRVDAYSVIGQRMTEPGWTVLASIAAGNCPEPPGICELTFPSMGPVSQCFKVMVINPVASISSKQSICYDPVWEAPVPPTVIEGTSPL